MIRVKANDSQFSMEIKVVDTISPKVITKKYVFYLGDDFDVNQFTKEVDDQTNVTAKVIDEIDLTKESKSKVRICYTDEGGNETIKEETLQIMKDTKPPIIKVPFSISVAKGESILYKKGVTIIDNRDGEITDYLIDNTNVNINKEGTYYVIYSAKDQAGNSSSKKVKVIIRSKESEEAKKEADVLAKKILNKITEDSMSKQQRMKKIYDYVNKNYIYSPNHEGNIDDYYIDAYNGLKTNTGNCYVVNAMARILCENAGIKTIGVIQNDGKYKKMKHISFMADTGDGFYHYCAFRKNDKTVIYKWTDKQFIEYSKKTYYLNEVDLSNYPNTPK